MWHRVYDKLPEYGEEVIIRVDGHRGPSWSNNFCLVAYLAQWDNEWYEERHPNGPVKGVIEWAEIPK